MNRCKNYPTDVIKPSRFKRPGRFGLKGFTMIEMVLVVVITGIIASVAARFLKTPVDEYFDTSYRADSTDIADTALRRMARDIRTAVPNSMRLFGSTVSEFLPTKTGGRYRADNVGNLGGCGASGNELDFTTADACFEITGAAITFAANDYIALGSTQADGSLPYDSSANGVLRAYTGAAGSQSKVNFTATQLPASASLSSQRFEVISGSEKAVTYACNNLGGGALNANGDGQGELRRYWNYGFNTTQLAPPFASGSNALLADKISACSISYNTSNQRNGLITMTLTITRDSESVRLYHEIHVNNLP